MSALPPRDILSPELLTFRDFMREPPGAWLWPGGPEPFARVSGQTYRVLAQLDQRRALAPAQAEQLRRHGVLIDTDALDEHMERVGAALGLLAEHRLSEAAVELGHARRAAPALTTTWLEEAFTLLRMRCIPPSRRVLHAYLERWPGDPAASALLAVAEQGTWIGDQRGHVMTLARSEAMARELVVRAETAVDHIRALCGNPPSPTILLQVTDSRDPAGRCLRGGSPFARLIQITQGGVEDPVLLVHEAVHATLSSSNLAFAEGLALHVSARLSAPSSHTWTSAQVWPAVEREIDLELTNLFLDVDAQPAAFDQTHQDTARARGEMPRAHWLAFLGTTVLVAQVGLAAFVDYLRWLRDPTPTAVLTAQEQLFELHFRASLREALRWPSSHQPRDHASR